MDRRHRLWRYLVAALTVAYVVWALVEASLPARQEWGLWGDGMAIALLLQLLALVCCVLALRGPRAATIVLCVACLSSGLAFGWVALDTGPRVTIVLMLQLLALGCCVFALWRAKETPVLLGGALVAGLLILTILPLPGLAVLFMVVSIAPFRVRLSYAALLTVLAIGGYVWVTMASSSPYTWGLAAGLGWALLVAALVHQMGLTRRQAAALDEARASEAMMAERQQLAREIHDVLAHSLSAQIVHLEGTHLLLQQGGDVGQALDRVATAGELARRGLEEARHAVEALRGTQPLLSTQLERLAADFRTATGRPCSLTLSDVDAGSPAPAATLALVRTAQEALSNVRRHAPDAEVTMTVNRTAEWIELEVRDTGAPDQDQKQAGNGYGLVGMRERAELVGGELEAGHQGAGFRILLRVPA